MEIYSPAEEAACTGIVCFNVGDLSSSEAADALARAGIAVRGGLHCAPGAHRFLGTLLRGAVRASVSAANTFEEVEAFLRTVREISVDSRRLVDNRRRVSYTEGEGNEGRRKV